MLFGLEIAFTLQAMKGRVFERKDPRGALDSADPQWLAAGRGRDRARLARAASPVSRQGLAEDLDLRLESVAELVSRLEAEGLVHQVTRRGTEDVGLTLALPPDRIPLARIAELASRLTLGTRPREGAGWGALARDPRAGPRRRRGPDDRGSSLVWGVLRRTPQTPPRCAGVNPAALRARCRCRTGLQPAPLECARQPAAQSSRG